MTLQEFDDNVSTFYDLREFCYDNECDILDDIIDEDCVSDIVENQLLDFARDHSWDVVRDTLSDIPTSCGWYVEDGWLEFIELDDDDFDRYKDQVREWAQDQDVFGEEEEEEAYICGVKWEEDTNPLARVEVKELIDMCMMVMA